MLEALAHLLGAHVQFTYQWLHYLPLIVVVV